MTETTSNKTASSPNWPSLRVDQWTPSRDTLHMWTQIVGKIRLAHAPMVNHWWQVTLYVSPRGLTTSAISYEAGVFDIEFDFIEHRLHIRSSEGGARRIALEPKSVADFYTEAMSALDELGIAVQIRARPNEVDPAIPFADDHTRLLRPPRRAPVLASTRVGRPLWSRPEISRFSGLLDVQLSDRAGSPCEHCL